MSFMLTLFVFAKNQYNASLYVSMHSFLFYKS